MDPFTETHTRHDVLDVGVVMARYGLRDRRAARRVMEEAGAFLLAGRLRVRLEDLVAHEDRLKADRGSRPGLVGSTDGGAHRSSASRRSAGDRSTGGSRDVRLSPEFWRSDYENPGAEGRTTPRAFEAEE